MAFVPIIFSSLGKKVTDLLTKNLKDETKVRIKTKTMADVTLDSSVKAKQTTVGTDFIGSTKASFTQGDVGRFELEFATDGTTSGSITADKFSDGLVVKLEGVSSTKDTSAALSAEYSRDNFIGNFQVQQVDAFDVSKNKGKPVKYIGQNINLTGGVGIDGLSVGFEAKYSNTNKKLNEVNGGFEYVKNDLRGGVRTKDNHSVLVASFLHRYNYDVSYGVEATLNTSNFDRHFKLGATYQLDNNAFVKGVFDTENRKLKASLQQRLSGFRDVSYALFSEFDAAPKSTTPEKFGVVFTLGEADRFQ